MKSDQVPDECSEALQFVTLEFDFSVTDSSSAAALLSETPRQFLNPCLGKSGVESGDHHNRLSAPAGFFFAENELPGRDLFLGSLFLCGTFRKSGQIQSGKGRLKGLLWSGHLNPGLHGQSPKSAAPKTPALSPSCGRRIRVWNSCVKTCLWIQARVSPV